MNGTPSPVRQFLRSSGVMLALYIGSAGLTFLVGAMLARLLGPSNYGVYALAMTTATLIGMVTEFGLPVLAMREVGAARGDGNWSMVRGLLHWADRVILGLSLVLIAATFAGYALFTKTHSSAYLATLLWAVALVPVVAIGKLRSFVLLALDSVLASQFPVMILRPALFLGGCLALWWANGYLTPEAAMAAQVGGAAAAMLVVLVLFARDRPPGLAKAQPSFAVRGWLSACLPMGMTEGLRLLQGQLALILVGALAGVAQAGIYRVADAALQVTSLLTSVAGTAATPLFGRLWSAGDRVGTERVAVLSAWVMLGGVMLLGLPVAIGGYWLFPMIFGPQFAGSVPVFWALWGGVLLASTCGLALALANMTGQHVLSTMAFTVIALVNVAAGSLLVPRYGALGAALASGIASITGAVFCTIMLRHRTGLNASLFNPAALGIAIAALTAAKARFLGKKPESGGDET